MRTAVAAASLLLAGPVLVAGCGSAARDATAPPTLPLATGSALAGGLPTGEVFGRLLRVGGPAGSPAVPIMGAITMKGAGQTIQTSVDSHGSYRIRLSPGVYRITATSPQVDDGHLVCTTDPPTTRLAAGRTVQADIRCSVK